MGELFIPPSAGGPDEITPTLPNKYSLTWGEWRKHVVKEASYVKSVESSPAVGYILNGPTPPNGDRITDSEIFPIKNGYGIMPYPGTWWIRWVQPATAAGVENYVLKPGVSAEVLRILLALEAFPEGFDLVKWGGTLVSAAQAGSADANFAAALVGPPFNARLAGYDGILSGDWRRLNASLLTSYDGSSRGIVGMLAAAHAYGRDSSDGTMRAIESRPQTGVALANAAIYRLLVESTLRGIDAGNGAQSLPIYADAVSAIVGGRAYNAGYNLWTNALAVRYDPGNAVLMPSSQARTATGTSVAPAANVVLATLDSQDLAHKSIMVTDTAVGSYNIQASIDAVTYRTIVAGAATAIGTVVPTAAQLETLKGFRFIRITSGGSAGTQIAEISAQGS